MGCQKEECWALVIGATGTLSLIPSDLRYFHDHFCGRLMAPTWRGPPPFTVQGKSKHANDFVSWHVAAPIVSVSAREVFRESGASVEYLSIGKIQGKDYFAVNALLLEDYIDFSKSLLRSVPGVEESIPISIVIRDGIDRFPPVFKLKGVASGLYVSSKLAEMLVKADLSGFSLVRPSTNIFARVIRGETLDDYRPGPGRDP